MIKKTFLGRVAAALVLAFALTFISTSSVASAGANINYVLTDVSTQDGRAVLYGYFSNNGNSGGTVTEVRFLGYIGNVPIDVSVEGMSFWVSAGSTSSYTITIYDRNISSRTSETSKLSTDTIFY